MAPNQLDFERLEKESLLLQRVLVAIRQVRDGNSYNKDLEQLFLLEEEISHSK